MDPTDTPIGEMAHSMGVVLTEVGAARTVGTMPVEGNRQPFGLLNGGASMALVETLGSIAANVHAGPGRYAVGIEVSGSHHRSARSGIVTGVATALALGRTVATYEVVVSDDQDRRLCTGRITCLLRDAE